MKFSARQLVNALVEVLPPEKIAELGDALTDGYYEKVDDHSLTLTPSQRRKLAIVDEIVDLIDESK